MDSKRIIFNTNVKFNLLPSTNGGPGIAEGYAMVWNVKSTDRGGYKVALAPGSARFDSSTFALWNHDYSNPLARTDNGTLTIACDDFGAKVSIVLPNTQLGKDTAENIRTELVKGMSFGMLVAGAKFTTAKDKDGDEVDTFTEFGCDEVTITPIPAFLQTSIGIAGPSPYAQEVARQNFSRILAEQNEQFAKHESYLLMQYPTSLAEFQ
jgi:uncharacterized protein